jgi:hypothetical protein
VTSELLRQWGLLCEDPDCTATHVDAETLPEITFEESDEPS